MFSACACMLAEFSVCAAMLAKTGPLDLVRGLDGSAWTSSLTWPCTLRCSASKSASALLLPADSAYLSLELDMPLSPCSDPSTLNKLCSSSEPGPTPVLVPRRCSDHLSTSGPLAAFHRAFCRASEASHGLECIASGLFCSAS